MIAVLEAIAAGLQIATLMAGLILVAFGTTRLLAIERVKAINVVNATWSRLSKSHKSTVQ